MPIFCPEPFLAAVTAALASQEEIMSETTPTSPRDQLLRLIAAVRQTAQQSRLPIKEQAGSPQAQMLPSQAVVSQLTEIQRLAEQVLGAGRLPELFTSRLVEACQNSAIVSEFNLERGLKALSQAVAEATSLEYVPPPVAAPAPNVSPRELSELIAAAAASLQPAVGADDYYDPDTLLAYLGPVSTAGTAVLGQGNLPERFADVMRQCFLELTVAASDVTLGLSALCLALTETAAS
jgi:hypothetical protein